MNQTTENLKQTLRSFLKHHVLCIVLDFSSSRTCVEVNDSEELHSDNAFKTKCHSDSN